MACKVIVAAAAAALMVSFLLPSGVIGREHIGNCPFSRSRFPDCRTGISCSMRCQKEGYNGGFCDDNQICMCEQCRLADHSYQLGPSPSPSPSSPQPPSPSPQPM